MFARMEELSPAQASSVAATGTDPAALASELASVPEVRLAYLFGSVARGQADILSDVDVAVLLSWGCPTERRLQLQLEIMRRLSRFTQRDIEVVLLNHADPVLGHEVVSTGILLYARSEEDVIDFASRAYQLYFDYQPCLELFARSLHDDISKGGILGRRERGAEALAALGRVSGRSGADAAGGA